MDVPCFHRCLIFFLPTSRLRSPYCGHHLVLRVVVFVGVCVIGDALAEPTPDTAGQELEHVALRHKDRPRTIEKRLLSEEWGLRFYGYLDGSYTQNFNNPANRINQLRIFDVNSNQFRPNLAQFVFDKEAKAEGAWKERAGFRMKINAGRDSDFVGGFNLNNWADVQELYLQYVAPIGNGLNVQLGQINTPVGYEVGRKPAQSKLFKIVVVRSGAALHHSRGACVV